MIEEAIRQGDATIAPGLHMNQSDSGQDQALDRVGGEQSPDRRITAESFRLLMAKLKKPVVAQAPVAVHEIAPAPHVMPPPPTPPPIEVIEETAVAVEAEAVVEVVADEAVPFPPFPEFEPVEAEPQALELASPIPYPEPEPDIAPEPESAPLLAETPRVEEPAQDITEAREPVFSPEPQAEVETLPEPEIVVEPESVSEPELPPAEVQLVEAAPAAEPEAPALEKPQAAEKAPPSSALRKPTHVEIEGIGEVARAIYMTPTSADRTAFLAECAAIAAAEAEAELAREVAPAIIYSEQFPTPKAKIRKRELVDDPFAKIELDDHVNGVKTIETDDDAGELARSLLDMMLSNPSAGLPQERALAADALLKLVPRIPLRALVAIVERVSVMEQPPHLLVTKLINDPRIEVAGPLLELCNHISDQVLTKVIATGQVSLMRLIARRRNISAALSDQLIQFDDTSVILTLVRNNGVVISHNAFSLLASHARRNPAVLAPLATRADLPAPIAFELFWFVPAELRRYLLSRFLTDSETLTKILKITQTMQSGENASEPKFAEREEIEDFVSLLVDGKLPEAAEKLAVIGGIHLESALRIVSDRDGEPLTIMLKAMGTNRARYAEIVEMLKNSDFGIIRSDRDAEELRNVFDSMSFNKARVLLTYWDWAVLKSGPYAPAN